MGDSAFVQSLSRQAALIWLDYYIASEGPLVGKTSIHFDEAPDDRQEDWDASTLLSKSAISKKTKRYCAEVFITKLLNCFGDLGFSPEMSCMYLDQIANRPDMPDSVVDVAIAWQDRIIEAVPHLRSVRDEIYEDYPHIISLTP